MSIVRSQLTRLRPGLIVLILAVGAVAWLSYLYLSAYEVLDKGQLLPYTEGKVYKVGFPGGLILYFEFEVKPSFDLLNVYLLVGVAFAALVFSLVLACIARDTGQPFRFFVLAFLGMSYLGADELIGIHETLGHNLQWLAALPFVERPDDAIVLFFVVPAVAILIFFRSVIFASRPATFLFAICFACFLFAAVADILALPIEEPVEVIATAIMLAALLMLGLHHLRDSLNRIAKKS